MSLPQGEIRACYGCVVRRGNPCPSLSRRVQTPLTTREIVDTLDRLRVLELEGDSPWPDLGDGDDTFPVDWRAVETETASELDSIAPADEERRRPWDSVEGELRSRVRPRGGPPPTVLVDALAWYQPIHDIGHAWGIYIRESAVFDLAGYLVEALPENRRFAPDVVFGAIRTSLGVLYLHEAFHHRMESFAIRLEIVEQAKRFCPYHDSSLQAAAGARFGRPSRGGTGHSRELPPAPRGCLPTLGSRGLEEGRQTPALDLVHHPATGIQAC